MVTKPLRATVPMVLVAMLWGAAPSVGQPLASPKHVLVLHYYGSYQPAIRQFDQGLQQVIGASSPDAVDFHVEYLDLGRRSGPLERSLTARQLREKYQNGEIAAVVTVTDGALAFLKTEGLFDGVPTIAYTERKPPPDAGRSEPNVIRIWSGAGAAQTIRTALRFHPRARQLFVLSGKPDNDDEYESEVRAQLATFADRLRITYLTDLPMPELLARVRTLSPDALLLHVRVVGKLQANRPQSQTVAEISKAATVPMYALLDLVVGAGAVGGYVTDLVRAGAQVGEVALRVAAGTAIASLPPQQLQPAPVFDARELKHWRIDRRDLPAGSVVRFYEPGFWELYWGYVVAAMALCALQTAVIGALVAQRARRRETEAKNTAILRAVPDHMFLLDKSGRYVDYNAPARGARLWSPHQFLGRNMREVLPQSVFERIVPLFQQVWQTDQPVAGEFAMETAGSQRFYEARLVRCHEDQVLGVMRDITDRTKAETALAASERRYALATAAGRSGVWDWDIHTNQVYVDPLLKAILGIDDAEGQNHFDSWIRVVHPDDRGAVLERSQAHLDGKTPFYELEHRMLHTDGSVRWFLARGSAVLQNGTAVRIVGTQTDITERKQSEEALQETQAELARVSRLTLLGEFAASIAHEVSQPVTSILLNTRACLRWLGGTSPNLTEIRSALTEVVGAGRRAEEVIRRNRELFRHQMVQKATLDINDVIEEAAVLAGERLRGSEVTLATALDPGLPPVCGDRVELQLVLLNLIVNGIDAMEGIDRGARRIEIASLAVSGAVQVSVRDHGIGLEGVDIERMFMPSYTTKSNGTGVGLSISRLIIKAHGGSLWVEQNHDRGATFVFTVPLESTVAAT